MAVGRDVDRGGHVSGFIQDISEVSRASDDSFFTWFANAKSSDEALVKGEYDFVSHVWEPIQRLSADFNISTATALELGYGGGRLLAAACRRFYRVIGVDIHTEIDRVGQMLKAQGLNNFELRQTDGQSIPVANASVDFAYSFIVLQHVEFVAVFQRYIRELARTVKPGGFAIIYFGRYKLFSFNTNSKILLNIDRILEKIFLPQGYREIKAKVNCTNLLVSLRYAIMLCRKEGFSIKSSLVSQRQGGFRETLFGGQNGLIIQRTLEK